MNCYKYFFSLLILLYGFHMKTQAQFSPADSVYLNNIFKESMYISYWNYPGKWYQQPEISSVQNLYEQIDSSYKFYNNEFEDCYQKMSVSDILERDTAINYTMDTFEAAHNYMIFGNKNPFVKAKFELNNKVAYTYALIDSTSAPVYNTDHAFVIISGTGTNLLKQIFDGNGYHDLNCYVRNLLKPYGDIYIMSMPNEDHRAIFFNKKKATSLPTVQPPYMLTYLNAANKSLGLNRLIETVAMIKFLKTKYKKVFVLGLSTGGKVALWASLLSEPDAALISSGYSVLVDNDYNSQLINSMTYGNYLLVYDKDSTRSRLSQLHTQFLFTLAQNDTPIAQSDIDNGYTKNFFSTLSNTSFFYNYTKHAFPPCPAIDSFLQRCFGKAKVFLSREENVCIKDSIVMKLNFFGKPPFSFQLYKDTTLVSTHSTNTTDFTIPVFDEGNYLIKNILDSAGNPGYTSDTFFYKKHPQPGVVITKKEFVCDSSKTRISVGLAGQSPFTLFYTKNNIPDSLILHGTQDSVLLSDGSYHFLYLKDSNKCEVAKADNITLNAGNLDLNIIGVYYNCANNKNEISLVSSGTLPLKLIYYDSLQNSFRYQVLNTYSEMLLLDSGSYHFISITDSNNCTRSIDSSLSVHSEPVSLSYQHPVYNCYDDFTVLPVQLKGKNNWHIQMAYGNALRNLIKYNNMDTIHIQPGVSKILKITDGNNCETKITDSLLQNPYTRLSSSALAGPFDCTLQSTPVTLFTTGNYPMYIYSQRAGQTLSEAVYTSPVLYNAAEGYFSIDSIVDNTGCVLRDIYNETFMSDTISADGIYQDKLKIRTSNTSFSKYYWYLNDLLYKETSEPYIDIEKNGTYEVGFFNNNHCFLKTNKLMVDMGKIVVYPNPVGRKLNVFVKLDTGEKIHYSLSGMPGNQLLQNTLRDGLNTIYLPELPKGIYMLNFQTNKKNLQYPAHKIYKN